MLANTDIWRMHSKHYTIYGFYVIHFLPLDEAVASRAVFVIVS